MWVIFFRGDIFFATGDIFFATGVIFLHTSVPAYEVYIDSHNKQN